LKKFEDSEA
jgi:hypothetical protein